MGKAEIELISLDIEQMNNAIHATVGVQTQFVLPQPQDANASSFEFRGRSSISKAIALNFGLPESAVVSGYMPAPRATVPKATIYKYRDTISTKIEIWMTQNVFRCNFPAANSSPYQSKSQFAFSSLIAASFDCSHVTGTFCRDANEPAIRQLMSEDSLHDFSVSAEAEKINSVLAAAPKIGKLFQPAKCW